MINITHISAVMILKNAEKSLKATLKSLQSFQEVIILDNGSTDSSLSIAEQFDNVKVFHSPFTGFGPLKNLAASYAKNDWVFSIDSDEIISSKLLKSIANYDLSNKNSVGIIHRVNEYLGKKITTTDWGNEFVYRIYNKNITNFTDVQVHETIIVKNLKKIKLKGELYHESYTSISEIIEKMQFYTTLNVEQNINNKRVVPPFMIFLKTVFAFFRSYILKRGFLSGWRGFLISAYVSITVFFKYFKMFEHAKVTKMKNLHQGKYRDTIAFANLSKTWGGGEEWFYSSGKVFFNRGHNILFIVTKGSKLEEKIKQDNLPYISIHLPILPIPILIMNKVELKDRLKTVSSIILNSTLELKLVAPIARNKGVSNIIFRRGIPISPTFNFWNKFLFKKYVDKIVSNSLVTDSAMKNFKQYSNVDNSILHNVVKYQSLPSPKKTPTAIIVSRLAKEKGVDLAIKAWEKVIKKVPDGKLLIVGDGIERINLESQVKSLKLDNSIEFLGFQKNVRFFIQQAKVLVLPSRWEGFGFVLLEAMSCNLPCIAFDKTSALEIIENDKSGYIVDYLDIDAMANAITDVLVDDEKANKMGQRGNQILFEKFNQDDLYSRLKEILQLN